MDDIRWLLSSIDIQGTGKAFNASPLLATPLLLPALTSLYYSQLLRPITTNHYLLPHIFATARSEPKAPTTTQQKPTSKNIRLGSAAPN
ncbi:hypothetical protein P886_1740 [Alteromonadaceae bacterium 2753L.S.0a.02]|nr:hypothetical protein P886_1740 [Alteromonadaceae bacterium 2753L.S.0a.02]